MRALPLFAAIDIPGSTIWRYLEEKNVPAEALAQAFPVGRMGRPEELVEAAKCLCCDEARYSSRAGRTPRPGRVGMSAF